MSPGARHCWLCPTSTATFETLAVAASVLAGPAGHHGGPECLARAARGAAGSVLVFRSGDLRGYHYHNGVVFAAYHAAFPSAIALGGRYDGVGKSFGRARPATGFSMDLRELARLTHARRTDGGSAGAVRGGNSALAAAIAVLRAQGEVVVELLPDEKSSDGPLCDRQLVDHATGNG
jgi:ATP phosphoribosyltransferase regulatory subunit